MSLSSLIRKEVLFSSKSFTFIQKGETVGLPKSDLWTSQLLVSQRFIFLKCFHKIVTILQNRPVLYEEGPALVSKNFLHAEASAIMPSNVQGSKNWILISNFAAWFLMASILARLNRSWSSKKLHTNGRVAYFIPQNLVLNGFKLLRSGLCILISSL